MGNYRIRVTTAAKLWGGYTSSPDTAVFVVQRRFWGFLWHNVCKGYSEMWARNQIKKREEVDAKYNNAVQQSDYFIEVNDD